MSSSRPQQQQSKPLDLDITIVSAKRLHNCNWRHGDLKPYVTFWIEPGRRFTTKPDDAGSTRPTWNERFIVPINGSAFDSLLSIEINHSDEPSLPTPLVGSVQFPLKELIVNSDEWKPIRSLEIHRPSGRPQGKIRVKISLKEREQQRQDYQITPPPFGSSYYYSSAPPPPPPPRDYRNYPSPSPQYTSHLPPVVASAPAPPPPGSPYHYGGSYGDPYSGYYSGYYSQLPLPPNRMYVDQGMPYSGGQSGPSAPVDYSGYDQRVKGGKMGLGTGLAVGAVAGALGGLALEEGLKHEEDKIADRVEEDLDGRESYSGYRVTY